MAKGVKKVGEIVWVDLTVPDAGKVRDFYLSVTGWEADGFKVGDYEDYVIKTPENNDTVAGICHARAENAALPPAWLMYIKVENLDASVVAAQEKGGKVLTGPKAFGASRYCVLRDPAGAVFAVIEEGAGDGQ